MSERSTRAEESTAEKKIPEFKAIEQTLLEAAYHPYVPRRARQFDELSFILGVCYGLLLVAIFARR